MSDSQADPIWFPAREFRIGAGRPTRAAVEKLLNDSTGSALTDVLAVSIRDAADLVDSSRSLQDPQMMLKATARLESLLGRLKNSGGSQQGGSDPAARLGALVGRGPDVVDEEES